MANWAPKVFDVGQKVSDVGPKVSDVGHLGSVWDPISGMGTNFGWVTTPLQKQKMSFLRPSRFHKIAEFWWHWKKIWLCLSLLRLLGGKMEMWDLGASNDSVKNEKMT